MIKKRLLTTENKRSIKEAYKSNVVFRTIDAAYKEQEIQMKTFRFSPEEIWVNCFIGFDKILKNLDDIDDITNRMWYDTFCELRDDSNEFSRDFHDQELETATSCIIYSIVACIMASDKWEIIKYTDVLMQQISEHSDLNTIVLPFNKNIESNFTLYIQEYIEKRKYISDCLQSPKNYVDPINPIGTPQNRTKAKEGVKKRLEFMKGVIPDTETMIMSQTDYNKMIEAVEYLIENDVVKKQESRIRTNMKVAHLIYTFYLVFKNEGKCVNRQLWMDFLYETFSQMKNNKDSLSNHFADKPNGYNIYLGSQKRK